MLRQPGDGIAGGVGMAEEEELDALVAVVKDELVGEVEGGDLIGEGTVLARPVLLRSFEAVGPLCLEERLAPLLGDDRRAELRILHVPVGVVAVVVGVEDELDRLVGPLTDRGDRVLRLAGEVGIDDQDEVAEDDEALIAAGEHRLGLCLAEEHPRRHLRDRRLLGGGDHAGHDDPRENERHDDGERGSHEGPEEDRHGEVPEERCAWGREPNRPTGYGWPAGEGKRPGQRQRASGAASRRARRGWRMLAARIVAAPA